MVPDHESTRIRRCIQPSPRPGVHKARAPGRLTISPNTSNALSGVQYALQSIQINIKVNVLPGETSFTIGSLGNHSTTTVEFHRHLSTDLLVFETTSTMNFEKIIEDTEQGQSPNAHLINDVVQIFSWKELDVVVKDRKSKKPLSILANANGIVHAGEMIAIMGPSGSGKTTLLNALAHRVATAGATTTGHILINNQTPSLGKFRDLSTYVEQEDALIGSLTVHETINFAARMALSGSISKTDRLSRVEDIISRFGMQDQKDTIVGTPIKKGLSGGQKKRLGVASRLVTEPKIVFLDEPTSGLDSSLSFEVISYLKTIARENNVSHCSV